jgi:hypothetical protein
MDGRDFGNPRYTSKFYLQGTAREIGRFISQSCSHFPVPMPGRVVKLAPIKKFASIGGGSLLDVMGVKPTQ